MKNVRKLVPVDFLDMHGMEAWLEDLARKGLRFTKFAPCFAHFDRAAPAETRYHMEPVAKSSAAPDEEQTAYLAQQGWDYMCRVGMYFHLYRAADPQSADFHTDPVAQSYTLDSLSKKLTRYAVLLCLMMVGELGIILFSFFDSHFGVVHQLVGFSSTYLYFMVLLLLFFTAHFALEVRGIRRLRRRLRDGVPAPADRVWRHTGLPRQIYTILMNLTSIVVLCAVAYTLTGGSWRGELDTVDRPYPILSLAELEGDPDYTPLPFYYPGYEGPDRDNYVTSDWNLLARRYEVDQSGEIPGKEDRLLLKMNWYDLTLPALASPLVDDLFDYHLDDLPYQPERYAVEEMTVPGFDRLVIATDVDYGGQSLFACAGDKVLYLNYDGGQDLTDHLEEISALLAWNT